MGRRGQTEKPHLNRCATFRWFFPFPSPSRTHPHTLLCLPTPLQPTHIHFLLPLPPLKPTHTHFYASLPLSNPTTYTFMHSTKQLSVALSIEVRYNYYRQILFHQECNGYILKCHWNFLIVRTANSNSSYKGLSASISPIIAFLSSIKICLAEELMQQIFYFG